MTKHYITAMLTQPLMPERELVRWFTVRDLQRGLEKHANLRRSIRQIRRVIAQLEANGVLVRHRHDQIAGHLGERYQATRYEIVDFDRAFEDLFPTDDHFSNPGPANRKRNRHGKERWRF